MGQRIEASFITYNAHVDSITITYVTLFFTHAGQMWKKVEPITFWATTYRTTWNYIFDGTWVALNLYTIMTEGQDMLGSICQYGLRRGFKEYISFWNGIDWINCLYCILIVMVWLNYNRALGETLTYLKTAKVDIAGNWEDDSQILEAFSQVDAMAIFTHWQRRVLVVYPFVLVFRFFKSFHAQPRLALVTNTLVLSYIDIFHF